MLMQARPRPSLFEANTANLQEQQAKHPMSFMELLNNEQYHYYFHIKIVIFDFFC